VPRRPLFALSVAAALVVLAGCGEDPTSSGDDGDAPALDGVPCETGDPGAGLGEAEPSAIDEGVVINEYDARLTISDSGDLAATETLTVEFPDSDHHGIYRDFSEDDYAVADPSGTVDGEPHSEVERATDGVRLVLGQDDVTLDAGEHTFGIAYAASGVLEPATEVDQDRQFDASILDPGWALDIEHASITIGLPAPAGDVSCVAGLGATASIDGAGTTTLVLTADGVPAGSGVRVLVGVDVEPDE
jgi:hypothetical protein